MSSSPNAHTRAPSFRVVFLLLITVAALRPARSIGDYRLAPWTFTYEFGFVRRALVGDVTSRLFGPPSAGLITVLSLAIMLVLAAALVKHFLGPVLREPRIGTWLFALAAATHSATIPTLTFELGRFEQIGFLIVLVCLAIPARRTSTFSLVVVPAACVIGLLVHEAFFFMFLPLIMAAWWYAEEGKGLPSKIVVMVGLVAVTWALGRFGRMNLSFEEYVGLLEARHSFRVNADSVRVLYADLGDIFDLVVGSLFRRWQAANHAVLLLILLPTFFLFRRVARVFDRVSSAPGRCRVVLGAALSPLLLYAVGMDVSRWWGIAVANLFIAFSYLAMREDVTAELADEVERIPAVVALVVGLSLVAGPIGVIQAYPQFRGLWLLINNML